MTGSAKQSISPRKERWIASSQVLLAKTPICKPDSDFEQPRNHQPACKPTSLRAQAKQSISPRKEGMDCFVASAPRKDAELQASFRFQAAATQSRTGLQAPPQWFETRGVAALLTMSCANCSDHRDFHARVPHSDGAGPVACRYRIALRPSRANRWRLACPLVGTASSFTGIERRAKSCA